MLDNHEITVDQFTQKRSTRSLAGGDIQDAGVPAKFTKLCHGLLIGYPASFFLDVKVTLHNKTTFFLRFFIFLGFGLCEHCIARLRNVEADLALR